MRFKPVRPARVAFEADGTPMALDHGDVYHARAGALAQARAVFLNGNRLLPDAGQPARWAGRDAFTILETGFGLGHNFLATWMAWRGDPHRPQRLCFVSIEGHPVGLEDARRAHRIHDGTPLDSPSAELLAQWPPATPDLHRASFDQGRVVLLVAHADISDALRELRLQADALFLDGFSPSRNPRMWTPAVFKTLGRLSAPDATAATWSSAAAVREGLTLAGFETRRQPGFAGKRDMTVAVRKPRPHHHPWPLEPIRKSEEPPVLIIGAGLAGAACARALAERGIASLVLDRGNEPAAGASGNPAGLFHGVLHPEEGAHARWSRAASWLAAQAFRRAIDEGSATGAVHGLLRREDALAPSAMQALVEALGLPPEYVQVLDGAPAGVDPQTHGAWWLYTQGGWIDPGAWVRSALQHPQIRFKAGAHVSSLVRHSQADGGWLWSAADGQGHVLAASSRVVLCSGWGMARFLPEPLTADWTLQQQRGQITRIPAPLHTVPPLRRPMSGMGYTLTLANGDLLCGATADLADEDPQVRIADHRRNLDRLESLIGPGKVDRTRLAELTGRVGWRLQTDDRLPIVGPCPAWPSSATRSAGATRLRDHPVEPGLFVATALGSRGITWAPLIGQVIAAWITGDPAPVPGGLLDAIDPRRFRLRSARRSPKTQTTVA